MGSHGFGARKEVAGGAQGLGVCPQLGSHSADLSFPCSLPLPDPKVVWIEYHTPSTPTLVRPKCGRDALHLSHSCFSMGLAPFSSFWKAAGGRRGRFVLSGRPWSLSAPGALLRSPQCGVWGGTCWHCRAQLQNPCPGCFLCFPQDDSGLQYEAPFLSNQVSTAGRDHSTSPSWLSCCSSTVPPHSLKQKQWPWPQPVPLGLGQARFAQAGLSLQGAPLHFLLGLSSLVLPWDRKGMS